MTRATVAKVNEVRDTFSNTSPLRNEPYFRVVILPTVQVSMISVKEWWPGSPRAHLVAILLVEFAGSNNFAEVHPSRQISSVGIHVHHSKSTAPQTAPRFKQQFTRKSALVANRHDVLAPSSRQRDQHPQTHYALVDEHA